MPNFFTDNDDIQFQFATMPLQEVIRLTEDDYSDAGKDPLAPVDYEDALDNYRLSLELAGEIAGDFIAPRAEQVDIDGPTLEDGEVTYAPGITESLELLAGADLMGFTLPSKYGGLNIPNCVYMIATEMVSRADASLMNLFGLQEIAETIHSFADEDIKNHILPIMAQGKVTAAMVLTEPDAGSDLQAVQLKATQCEDDPDKWVLNGVKRFITNGCGDVLLVLARSEAGTEDARGLSMFYVEKCPEVKVRRIEEKLGIHGSPTCELVFKNTPAILIGQRRRGLIRYVMSLMNGARVAIAAQSVGIAEAAYRAALGFARERRQFNTEIIHFPAVYDLLTSMKLRVQAARALSYDAALSADMERLIGRRIESNNPNDDKKALKAERTRWARLAAALTPMAKYYASEACNSVAYDAIQIHGGSGFMKDYPVERYYRDARITSIYEGPSQLQVIAIVGSVLSGALGAHFEKSLDEPWTDTLKPLADKLATACGQLTEAVAFVKEKGDTAYTEFHSGRLVDVAIDIHIGCLFLTQARDDDSRTLTARKFINDLVPKAKANCDIVLAGDTTITENYELILNDAVE